MLFENFYSIKYLLFVNSLIETLTDLNKKFALKYTSGLEKCELSY